VYQEYKWNNKISSSGNQFPLISTSEYPSINNKFGNLALASTTREIRHEFFPIPPSCTPKRIPAVSRFVNVSYASCWVYRDEAHSRRDSACSRACQASDTARYGDVAECRMRASHKALGVARACNYWILKRARRFSAAGNRARPLSSSGKKAARKIQPRWIIRSVRIIGKPFGLVAQK